MDALYTRQEIAQLADDYRVTVTAMRGMISAGFDPDGREGPSMALDMDQDSAGYCPECGYEHLDAPC